jgi:predicted lipid-binding transport protein (Tim44 family)
MQLVLRLIAIVSFIVAIVWVIEVGELEPEPILAFLGGLTSLALSFANEKKESGETLDQRNRRVMLDHVENFWVKGILEKSLHGAALLELGIKEEPGAVNYPWNIKRESTNETLPAGKSILEIFQEIGMGRSLLILGAPGSGKTTMLLELARQLIERARQDDTEPIPVVLNLSSWKENQTLPNWLVEQLNIFYYVPKKVGPVWVDGNKMLLLLDGLDEVKQDRRARCVDTINQFRKEQGLISLVVCSRMEEYAALEAKLSLEGAITIQPLTSKQIKAYFDRFGKNLTSVKQLLKNDKVLRELVETPLILSIMTLAYKDRKADELIASANLEEQRKQLFNTYITRMFERSTRTANTPLSKESTLHYLHYLARMMIKHSIITYQIETMQPSWVEPETQHRQYSMFLRLIGGLLFGLLFGLISGLLTGLLLGLTIGLIVGLIGWLISWLIVGLFYEWIWESIIMTDKLNWSWKEAREELLSELILVLLLGLVAGLIVGLLDGPLFGLLFGLFGGLVGGLLFGLLGGLVTEQIEETTYPGQRLRQTLFNTVFVGLMILLLSGPLVGPVFGLLVGLLGGLVGGLSNGAADFLHHFILRFMLAQIGLLPRKLIYFLDYAVDLIFLRRVGGSYIFVHRLLMEHFAEMDV